MKQKYINAHMKVAETYASLSSAKRLQVGAIVVKDNRVISIGYNGMPSGWDNNCEDVIGHVLDGSGYLVETRLKSKPEVLHAETNAIAKLARSNESGLGAAMFVTHAPCLDCAKLIYQAGISKVYYRNIYRESFGIDFLEKSNIDVEQI
jgi:dCMP deaminase